MKTEIMFWFFQLSIEGTKLRQIMLHEIWDTITQSETLSMMII